MKREVRYTLTESPAVCVAAKHNEYIHERRCFRENEQLHQAHLIDLSRSGAKLVSVGN
jgi:hypothetical protein